MGNDNGNIIIGSATILVNVGEIPLALIGTIKRSTVFDQLERKDDDKVIILGTVNVREREEFLIMDVADAILPEDSH